MKSVRRAARPACALLFSALSAVSAANAQAVDVRQACTPDAMRLCNQFIPDEARVRSCMMANRRLLSQECRSAIAAAAPVGARHGYVHHVYHVHHYYRHRG